MAKLTRERLVKERRARKEEKKQARKEAAAAERMADSADPQVEADPAD